MSEQLSDRELDALAAEKVMGLKIRTGSPTLPDLQITATIAVVISAVYSLPARVIGLLANMTPERIAKMSAALSAINGDDPKTSSEE